MKTKPIYLKAGERIHTAAGEYSDYHVDSFFLVQKDFEVWEQFQHFVLLDGRIAFNDDKTVNTFESKCDVIKEFYAYLEKAGFVSEFTSRHIHMGSYGDIEFQEL